MNQRAQRHIRTDRPHRHSRPKHLGSGIRPRRLIVESIEDRLLLSLTFSSSFDAGIPSIDLPKGEEYVITGSLSPQLFPAGWYMADSPIVGSTPLVIQDIGNTVQTHIVVPSQNNQTPSNPPDFPPMLRIGSDLTPPDSPPDSPPDDLVDVTPVVITPVPKISSDVSTVARSIFPMDQKALEGYWLQGGSRISEPNEILAVKASGLGPQTVLYDQLEGSRGRASALEVAMGWTSGPMSTEQVAQTVLTPQAPVSSDSTTTTTPLKLPVGSSESKTQDTPIPSTEIDDPGPISSHVSPPETFQSPIVMDALELVESRGENAELHEAVFAAPMGDFFFHAARFDHWGGAETVSIVATVTIGHHVLRHHWNSHDNDRGRLQPLSRRKQRS